MNPTGPFDWMRNNAVADRGCCIQHLADRNISRRSIAYYGVISTLLTILGCRETSIQPVVNESVPANHAASSWPALFGPNRNCVAYETNLTSEWDADGPEIAWEKEVGIGYSSPVIDQDRAIIFHREADEEVIECVDAADGETLWRFQYPTSYECQYGYSDGPYSTPVVFQDRVIAIGAEGLVHAVSLSDGSKIWGRDLHKDYQVEEGLFAAGATPLLVEGRLIICLGGLEKEAGIVALDVETGGTLWTATDHRASYAMPCFSRIHGQDYVFALTFEGLVALNPETGEIYWEYAIRPKAPDSVNATSPQTVDDLVLVVTGPGPGSVCLRILEDGTYEEVWRDRRVLDSQFNSLLLYDGCVFGFTAKRQGGSQFRCVDLQSGKLRWKFSSKLERGSVLGADGFLFLLGENGHLASMKLDREKATLISMSDPILRSPCYSAIALYKRHLYVRNEHRLLCLDIERKSK